MRILKLLKILGIYFFIIIQVVYAQNEVDSLKKAFVNAPDSSKIWINLKLSSLAWEKDPKEQFLLAENALKLSKKTGFRLGEAKSIELIGLYYYNIKEPAKAIEYFYNALDVYYAIGKQNEAALSNIYIGFIFNYFKKRELAIAYANKAKKILLQNTEPEKKLFQINDLCDLYTKLECYDSSLKISTHFQDVYGNTTKHYGARTFHYIIISRNLMQLKRKAQSLEMATKAQMTCEMNDRTGKTVYIYSLNNKANIFSELNNLDSSLIYFNKAIGVSKKLESKIWIAINYRDISKAYYQQKNMAKAVKYAQDYLKISIENQFLEDIKKAYQLLSEYDLAKKNYFSAYSYLLKYAKLSESISKDENSLFINNILYRRDIDLTTKQNVSLKKENIKKDTIIRDKQLLQLGLIIVTLMIFVFAIFVIFFIIQYKINNQLLKSKNEEIFEKNKQLENQNQLLERLNQEKNGLIGIVSHDLKAPLSRIESLINFVESEGSFNTNQELYLQLINKELENSNDLIKRILDSEIKDNADTDHNYIEELNVTGFINEIIKNYNITAASKQITIHPCYKAQEIKLSTNKNHLGRIMDNLLSNALKFSDTNKNIFIDIKEYKGSVKIDVRDEGPGLTEEDKKNLFKKYQKLSATPTAGETSTGLGLHIVRKLSFEIGGDIEVKSAPGEGSTFSVVLKKR